MRMTTAGATTTMTTIGGGVMTMMMMIGSGTGIRGVTNSIDIIETGETATRLSTMATA
jgi:hypothetical protein